MIIYSAIPVEYILEGMDQERHFQEVRIDDVTMIIEPVTPTQYRIVRLLSPNPQDYLHAKYTPGTVIHFRPTP
ncbi:MAG: YlzJ-like family protein [Bacillota bacterium]